MIAIALKSSELMNVSFSWSANTGVSTCRSPYNVAYESVPIVTKSFSPFLDGFQD